jgi:hypothetical protein
VIAKSVEKPIRLYDYDGFRYCSIHLHYYSAA